jgi:SAM-dependent methyltransferase
LEVLLLGVTPEIARFPWAADFFLTAVDASEAMIRSVWPGDDSRRRAIRSGWLETRFAAGSFDLILSDCGLTPLAGPGQLPALGNQLKRWLRPDGRVVMRHLARPAGAVSPDGLARLVAAGALRNFHELKLRLLMALPESAAGVRLGGAWECFQKLFPDRSALAARLGCSREIIDTIDAYRGREDGYVFPALDELARVFAGFSLAAGPAGRYPFAECCPVFSLTPRP